MHTYTHTWTKCKPQPPLAGVQGNSFPFLDGGCRFPKGRPWPFQAAAPARASAGRSAARLGVRPAAAGTYLPLGSVLDSATSPRASVIRNLSEGAGGGLARVRRLALHWLGIRAQWYPADDLVLRCARRVIHAQDALPPWGFVPNTRVVRV